MKNLNEDDLFDLMFPEQQQTGSYQDSFVSANAPKEGEAGGDFAGQHIPKNSNQIVIPPSIEETAETKTLQEVAKKNDKNEMKRNIKKRREEKLEPEDIPQEEYQEVNETIKEEIETVENVDVPDDVDIVEAEYEMNTALEDIPGGDNVEIGDLTFTKTEKKSKAGYYKAKVSWKRTDIPQQLKDIASYVKSQTKGLISPRIVDLIRIGNTNRVQLKNDKLKLGPVTIVFKPNPSRMRAKKFHRFMVSLPEDYKSTKNLIVYMQDGRKKSCLELTSKDFKSEEYFNQFLGDRIAEYFLVGYDVALQKIQLRNVDNPIMEVIDLVVKTNDYKAKPYVDDGIIYRVDFKSKGTKNEWLRVSIEKSNNIQGAYNVFARSIADDNLEIKIGDENRNNELTLEHLRRKILEVLSKLYNRNWDIPNERKETYMYYQLSKPVQRAIDYIETYIDDNGLLATTGLKMEKIKTKKEWKPIIEKENLPYYYIDTVYYTDKDGGFALSYLMLKVIGGDKRRSKSYITSQQYYAKTGVKTRDPYQKRRVKEDRNYNNAINVYQVVYTRKGKEHLYMAKTYEEVLEDTGLLTGNIKFPKSKY